jgi:NADH:flavin oxidoreductase / NADH oxidase family
VSARTLGGAYEYRLEAAILSLITEATQVSPQGVGYIRTPGLHLPAQVAGWRKVTDAVHRAGRTGLPDQTIPIVVDAAPGELGRVPGLPLPTSALL